MATDSFEWIDPFEQKGRAESAERRAQGAYSEGQRAIMRRLDQAAQNHFAEKLEAAVDQTAQKVALHALKSVGARMSYQYFHDRFQPAVSDAFREGCKDVIGAVIDRAQITTRVDASFASMDEMLVQAEIVEPVRVYCRFAL